MLKNLKVKLFIPFFFIFQTMVSAQTGSLEVVVQTGHLRATSSLAFSPANWNRYLLASGAADYSVKLWDTRQKRLLRTLSGHQGAIEYLAFTPDGKFLVSSGGRDNTLNLWNVLSGEKLLTIPDCGIAALSPNGKTVSCSQFHFSRTDLAKTSISLVNVDVNSNFFGTERNIAIPSEDDSLQVSAFVFSPDGKKLCALLRSRYGGYRQEDQTLKIRFWDITRTSLKPQEINVFDFLTNEGFEMPGFHGGTVLSQLAFSPDGNRVYLGDKTISVWDVRSRKLLTTYDDLSGEFVLNKDGTQIVAFNCGVGIWKTENMQKIKQVEEMDCTDETEEESIDESIDEEDDFLNNDYVPIALSKNDNLIAYGGQFLTITSDNGESFEFPNKAAALPASKIKLNDLTLISDGEELSWDDKQINDQVREPEMAGASQILAKCGNDKLEAYGGGTGMVDSAYGNEDTTGHVQVVKTEKGKRIPIEMRIDARNTNFPQDQQFPKTTSLAFLKSGKFLISGHLYGEIMIWSTETGKLINYFRGHSGEVKSIICHPQKNLFFTLGAESEIKIWRAAGDLIATWIPTGNGWLLTTPEGFFDGTLDAQREILWRLNNYTFDAVPVESFYYEFYYPGLLQKLLSEEKPELPEKALFGKDVRQAEVRLCSKCPCAQKDLISEKPFQSIVQVSDLCIDIIAPADFTTDDFIDFNSLARKLTADKDGFPKKIFADFAFDSQMKLKSYVWSLSKNPRKKPNFELRRIIKRELDSFLRKEEFFEKFNDVLSTYSLETGSLPNSNPRTDNPNWFIRQSLEAAFPEIRKGKLSQLNVRQGNSRTPPQYKTEQKGECPKSELCLQDLRLFWNGRLIQRWHGDMYSQANCLAVTEYRIQCQTKVPVIEGFENRYRAYVFNQDRVKSVDGEFMIDGSGK